jgi:mono/diheme cytochrome c family protein
VDYPIWEVASGGGLLMAVVAISHVIVSHFAIGGGLIIVWTEMLAVRRGDRDMRELARRGSLVLILISTVFGAISGVGIWVVAGLISPGAISALIHTYVWGWAIEWTFFVVEIVAALIYYTTWNRISKQAHLMVGWIYFVSAYLSLVVINGIITFMLTPGNWLESRAFWDGFFNPTYWPSLLLRTGIAAMMATAFLLFVVPRPGDAVRPRLVRYLGAWLVGGSLVAYAGYRWWEAALPESVLALFRGEAPSLVTLATTRSLALWALALTVALGIAVLLALPRVGRPAVLVVVALSAFTFFGGYERLREGVRKPFLIHSHLFSNGLRIDAIETVNERGMAATSGWVAARASDGPVAHGRAMFVTQCSSCHTLDGYQAIRPLLPTTDDWLALASADTPEASEHAFSTGCASCHGDDYTWEEMRDVVPPADEIREDPEFVQDMNRTMIEATLLALREMGGFYAAADRSTMVDTREAAYPHMPPLVGSDEDLEALAAYLASVEDPQAAVGSTVARGGE